jgi:hypothetical protein
MDAINAVYYTLSAHGFCQPQHPVFFSIEETLELCS